MPIIVARQTFAQLEALGFVRGAKLREYDYQGV
jgi:hypothetical protein